MTVENVESKEHWENIYKTKSSKEVSWHKPHLDKSLELILSAGIDKNASIIDVGGGVSTLVDDLLEHGFKNIAVLDISSKALEVSKNRLGEKASQVEWFAADITQVSLKPNHYDLWHDRAVFHFLTLPQGRKKYVKAMNESLQSGGHLIIATFGMNGPLRCSGLEIVRYSPESLQAELGTGYQLLKHFSEVHHTPFGTTQEFLCCHFQKIT